MNSSENHQSERKLAKTLVITFCLLSLFLLYLILNQNFIFGSAPGGWVYPYFSSTNPVATWIAIAVLLLCGVLIFGGSWAIRKHEKTTLAACFVIAVCVQVLLQSVYRYPMSEIIISDMANSFFSAAGKLTPGELLSSFTNLASTLPLHARSNMPGKILLFQLLRLLTSDAQVLGYIIVAVSTTGGLFLYGIVKRFFKDQTAALYAFILYILLPCKQDFFPILNTVTPVFILLALYLFILYLDSDKSFFLLLLGVWMYLLVIFEPSPLVTGIIFLGILVKKTAENKLRALDFLKIVLIPAAGFGFVYVIFYAVFSFDLISVFRYVLNDAQQFNTVADRGYAIWFFENGKSFFVDVGIPVMMIFLFSSVALLIDGQNKGKKIIHWSDESLYMLSLGLTYLILIFMGINRGETTRLWIYLAVFFQVPAALFMARKVQSHPAFFLLAATLVIQTLTTLPRVSFIIP